MPTKPALLMLDDGACFEGTACGACAEAAGEVVFTTGSTGYQETLTDPSYYRQIVTFTSAHMGNYGTCQLDAESPAIMASGVVMHDLFTPDDKETFPHWRADESLDAYLSRHGITGICGVDTRALTLHLRSYGSRNGIISATDMNRESLLKRARELPGMGGRDLASMVTCSSRYMYEPSSDNPLLFPPRQKGKKYTVAVLDYGVKRSILTHLLANGLMPTVWPATSSAKEVLASKPDGVMLSNGPGDPAACTYAIQTIKSLLGRIPVFGICLGHQLLALAAGGATYKLPFGHHGINHPVKDILTGRVSVTSQNHGFCVDPTSLPREVSPTHWNLNDGTLEGMAFSSVPAFSVQYHPEAAPGTWDSHGLFARFRQLIENTE